MSGIGIGLSGNLKILSGGLVAELFGPDGNERVTCDGCYVTCCADQDGWVRGERRVPVRSLDQTVRSEGALRWESVPANWCPRCAVLAARSKVL